MLGHLNSLVIDKLFKPPGENRCHRPGDHVSKHQAASRSVSSSDPKIKNKKRRKRHPPSPAPGIMRRGTPGDVSAMTMQVKPVCVVMRVMSDRPSPASAFLHQEKQLCLRIIQSNGVRGFFSHHQMMARLRIRMTILSW